MFQTSTITTNDFDSLPQVKASRALAGQQYPNSNNGAFVDYFRRQLRPNAQAEINNYKRFAYACANINANVVAECRYKLYVKTSATQRRPRTPTIPVEEKRLKDLIASDNDFAAFAKDYASIEEVIKHPLLDLLEKVNGSIFFDSFKLRNYTQLYQEITGKAYWWLVRDGLGRPNEIWLLPSQFVTPKKNVGSNKILDYYEYHNRQTTQKFLPEEIIAFHLPNLNDPYLDGMSPLEAAWEDNIVANKMISHESGMLDNEARPDVVLNPKEAIGEDAARRLEQEYQVRFSRGRGGGVYVPDEPIDLKPITWPPRDLARLEIHETTKKIVANAFDVPLALLQTENINRATLEAAQMQHGRYSIRPRLSRNCSVLNKRYIPLFDNSGRLFLGYDDPVPEDKAIKLQEVTQLVQAGVITRNEGREIYKYPPHPDGDELISANQPSEYSREEGKRQENAKR